jgi:steroid 5-alpha reductase family enzyme
MKQNRTFGFAVIAAIYIFATCIGIALFRALPNVHIFWRVFAGDVGATVFVYLTGVVLKNASVYDPYWSIAPIVIFTGIALYSGIINMGIFLLLLAVWYWGVRLTCNWAHTFKNLATQDWRYNNFKQKYPRSFQIVSFFGINMFPTIVVFLCLLPGIVLIKESAFNAVTILGFIVCVAAATIQLVADIQMHRFRRKNAENNLLIRDGLWKHARHPNYLGEILMWWGVYIIMLSSAPQQWYLGIGAAVNTLMFFFVSIPLADKHNRERRTGFDEYVQETNSLLPFRIKRQRTKENI